MNTDHPPEQGRAFIILVSLFIGSITIASVLSSKIINIFGVYVPAGVLAYSVTFVVTDVISEVWGAQKAREVVMGGFAALVAVLLLVRLALVWPPAPFWQNTAAFTSILGSTSRIIVASFTAYLISQLHDVWAFHFWRRKTRARHLWLRNNLSTMASQFIDSAIFINIAFYGVLPVWPLIAGQWIVKMAIAVLDTPVVYCVVGAMSARQGRKGAGAPREAAH